MTVASSLSPGRMYEVDIRAIYSSDLVGTVNSQAIVNFFQITRSYLLPTPVLLSSS